MPRVIPFAGDSASLPAPVNQWLFKNSAFDRKDWNHVLLGECLKQLALVHGKRTA